MVGERHASGETKYHFSNLLADTGLKALAAAIKARWTCEQAHQQLKEEFGPDHFEGRSCTGLHRHALMTMLALAFLQHRRRVEAGRGEKAGRATAAAQPALRAGRPRRPPAPRPGTAAMPALPQMDTAKVVLRLAHSFGHIGQKAVSLLLSLHHLGHVMDQLSQHRFGRPICLVGTGRRLGHGCIPLEQG